eukprot:748629-Hanusia_phi.AAC.2
MRERGLACNWVERLGSGDRAACVEQGQQFYPHPRPAQPRLPVVSATRQGRRKLCEQWRKVFDASDAAGAHVRISGGGDEQREREASAGARTSFYG